MIRGKDADTPTRLTTAEVRREGSLRKKKHILHKFGIFMGTLQADSKTEIYQFQREKSVK